MFDIFGIDTIALPYAGICVLFKKLLSLCCVCGNRGLRKWPGLGAPLKKTWYRQKRKTVAFSTLENLEKTPVPCNIENILFYLRNILLI